MGTAHQALLMVGAAGIASNVQYIERVGPFGGIFAENMPWPVHQAGDLLVIYSYEQGGAVPILPAGFTSGLTGSNPSGVQDYRVSWFLDVGNTEVNTTLTGADYSVGFIYRGAVGLGIVAQIVESGAPETQINLPAIGPLTSGSWVLAGVCMNQGVVWTPNPLPGYLERCDSIVAGGPTQVQWDTNTAVASMPLTLVNFLPGAFVSSWAIEVLTT